MATVDSRRAMIELAIKLLEAKPEIIQNQQQGDRAGQAVSDIAEELHKYIYSQPGKAT